MLRDCLAESAQRASVIFEPNISLASRFVLTARLRLIAYGSSPRRQMEYLQKSVDTAKRVQEENIEISVDLDDVTDRNEWTYAETQLQHNFECTRCHMSTDILGEYGSCPSCGKRNSGGIFKRKLNETSVLR